jgi:hypothetical protein
MRRGCPAAIVIVLATSLAGCGSSTTSTGGSAPDSFVAACEGDVGSRLEAHCSCIESAVTGSISQSDIDRELSNIQSGNPPAWFMKAAINCPN